jgi:hypothetical protein
VSPRTSGRGGREDDEVAAPRSGSPITIVRDTTDDCIAAANARRPWSFFASQSLASLAMSSAVSASVVSL